MEGRGPGSGEPTEQHGTEAIGDEPSNARDGPDAATEAIPEGQARAGVSFLALYDKVSRADILAHAYALSRANDGAAGVDGVRHDDIEAYGRERFLAELRRDLESKRYRPDAVLSFANIESGYC